ncbi:hypothetical protein MVLG_01270 [Microbotryum lychnidis-dioicae p1A1 Lamole]|uniref:HMG box domain-containing protein n=1 Tax=Microbotryum lychnidis-dioicae (strain p1A1 Lamole / MvSl-1064) TaxID=683840 RepID=U5H1L6_USTV1|nr:hypothetical protein MVLG_01270 [Microbotryum lychnidis-dioicae p1A1 Lamole]|eukprot:KDE08490.1 hypothetical protein MVLG_01270 [Microbotryum lychnidis-dioicae p1A1 Lamole]
MDSNMSSSSTPASSSSLSALAAGGPAIGSGSSGTGSSGDRQDYFGTLAIVDSAGASAKAPAPATLTGDNSSNHYNHQPLHHPTAYPYHASWVAGSVAPAPGSATAAASPSAGAPAASALSAAVGDLSNVLEPTRSRPSLHDRGAPLGSPSTLSNVGAAWINRYHQAMPRHTMSNGTMTTTAPASATSRGGTLHPANDPAHAIVPNQGHHAHGHAQAYPHHPAYSNYPDSSSSHHTQQFKSGGAALSHLLHYTDQTETSSAAPHCNPHGGSAPYPTPVTPSLLSSSNMSSNQTSITHVESSALEVAPNSVSSSAAAAAVAAAGATAPGSLHIPMAKSTTTTTTMGHPIATFSHMHSHLWPSYPSSTVASSSTNLGPAASRQLAPPAAATAPAPINLVHELLYSLHLTQYYDTFVAEGFDRLEALDDITEADFEAVGVRRGHRRLIQRHLASIKGLPTSAPLVLPIALGHGENGTISTVPALAAVKNHGLGKAEWVDPTVADQAQVVDANAADEFAPKSKMEDEVEESDDNQIGDVSVATTLVEDQEMSNLSSSTGASRARGGSKSRGVKRKSIAPAKTLPTSVTQTNRNVFYIHPTNSASVTRSTTASRTAVPIQTTAVSTSATPGTPMNPTMNPAKRRYRRHPKPDPNAPVKPSSAYVEFSTSIRAQLGTSKSFTEIARIVGEKWQALPCLEKADLERRTIEAKEAYARDLELYQQGKEWREYEAYLKQFRAKYPDSAIGPSTTAAGVAELETGSSPAPSGSGSGSTAGKESKVVGCGKGRGGRRSSTRTVQLAAPVGEVAPTRSVRMGRRTSARRSLAKHGAREELSSDSDLDGDGDGEGEGEDVDGEGETDEDPLVGSSTTTMTNGNGVGVEGKGEEFDKEQWDAVRVLANVHRRECELSR